MTDVRLLTVAPIDVLLAVVIEPEVGALIGAAVADTGTEVGILLAAELVDRDDALVAPAVLLVPLSDVALVRVGALDGDPEQLASPNDAATHSITNCFMEFPHSGIDRVVGPAVHLMIACDVLEAGIGAGRSPVGPRFSTSVTVLPAPSSYVEGRLHWLSGRADND